jgi:hypothetical protein
MVINDILTDNVQHKKSPSISGTDFEAGPVALLIAYSAQVTLQL